MHSVALQDLTHDGRRPGDLREASTAQQLEKQIKWVLPKVSVRTKKKKLF
jgi:hypothetical protein